MKKRVIISWILISFFLPTPLFADEQPIREPRVKGKKIVMILPARLFHGTELAWLKEIFERKKADILLASNTLSNAYTATG